VGDADDRDALPVRAQHWQEVFIVALVEARGHIGRYLAVVALHGRDGRCHDEMPSVRKSCQELAVGHWRRRPKQEPADKVNNRLGQRFVRCWEQNLTIAEAEPVLELRHVWDRGTRAQLSPDLHSAPRHRRPPKSEGCGESCQQELR
jgi:hypothetical protein